jgi:hypothetical protein
MDNDQQIEEAASLMYAAALAFTNTIGKKGWAWAACDQQTKQYWRTIANHVRNVFKGSSEARP